MHEASLTLPVEPPFRLDLTAWVLRRRAKNKIDNWDGQTYRRVFTLDNAPVLAAIRQKGINLIARLKSDQSITPSRKAELEKLFRKTLGMDVNLDPFYKLAASDTTLNVLAQQFAGVRPPRFPSLFETLVNAISCQQLSLDVGILLLNRLAEKYGKPLSDGSMILHAFPEPSELVNVDETALKRLGFSYQKALAIHDLAYTMADGDSNFGQLESVSNDRVIAILQAIRGIGRWSAEYVLLRGLGRLDVFPGDDISGQNNLRKLLKLDTKPSYEELSKLTTPWYPYAGLVYFHLLLSNLHEKELV